MPSLDSLKVRALTANGAVNVTYDDTPIMLRLFYVSTGSVTSVTVTTATNIVLIDTIGGTNTYAFATYTTLGALVDKINSDGYFEARIIDGLRTDALNASNIVENTAITAGTDDNGVAVWDCHSDDSVNKFITSSLKLNKNFNNPPKYGHRVHLQEIVYYAVVNGASADSVLVYFRNGTVENKKLGEASVASTKTTINFAAGQGKITAPEGADIIVRVQDATSLTDSASNYLQVTGIFE